MTATSIEWCDATWNPTRGCSRVSEGCRHCFAERFAARNLPEMRSPTTGKPFARMGVHGPQWTGKVELILSKLDEPLRWRKPRRIFVNSMSDLFHEALPAGDIRRVLEVMVACPHHTFIVLTKRPRRMDNLIREWLEARNQGGTVPRHIQLGVSVEDQATADERIPLLLQTPAAVRIVSYEPALAAVNFTHLPGSGEERYINALTGEHGWTMQHVATQPERLPRLDWLICGAESGPGARSFNPDWARSVRDECQVAGVAFFYKQDAHRGRKIPTPELDGRRWVEFPA